MAAPQRVDLQNCADEPIHIPGFIQPHGALLFLSDAGLVEGWSTNIATVMDNEPALGQPFGTLGLPEAVTELIQECLATMEDGDAPATVAALSIGGREYDCIVHGHMHRVLVEFETREASMEEVAQFAIKAHSSIDRLRRQRSIDGLLEATVRQIREFTGFDRVMAYRFRSDDSGDVVAEARRDDLVPYLGQRYPAGDIPPQARRLYVLNTLRMIADVGYHAVPLLGAEGSAPLDLSFAVLRSVSPVHVEYLQNMGVGASMSVSIVVHGRLWGLIACHHMAPKRVPYSVRMAADVLAQVIASTVQGIEAREDAELVEHAAKVRTSLVESLLLEDDPLEALVEHGDGLLESTHAQALVVSQYGRVVCRGVDQALGDAIVASLPAEPHDIVTRTSVKEWPDAIQARLGKWVGMLGLPFDPPSGGWCVLLRTEQIEEVAWGGKPDKTQAGPLGERLTPRGSFEAWHETVRGLAHPWEDGILTHARMMLGELARVSNARRAQTESTRAQLLAMLGHDLRDPLNSINMAGMVLERTDGVGNKGTLGKRIQSSSNRMQRMIGQVLDMSRIDRGLSLGIDLQPVDLAALLEDMAEEARLAYPTIVYDLHTVGPAFVLADGGRLGQVVSNLLSNARHHGEPNQPITIRLVPRDGPDLGLAVLEIANAGAPIPAETEAALFNPFKRSSLNNPRNRTGMGLGLYIAQQIVREHEGEIDYRHENGKVIFAVRLPLAPNAH
ncbi:GAF domain-containing protein [Massilia sp. NEAU-DD11]|uniref:histidine kinase n=1 Tax=Massilia cellulosiltytica TaxID=2683234 RepID=A0A7X3FYS4_9BURK|nr:ATP-binding protein [Telluria cellulosilytica]MVW60427.1 GAF domain-containing protein [Telluria cellulosilytica]